MAMSEEPFIVHSTRVRHRLCDWYSDLCTKRRDEGKDCFGPDYALSHSINVSWKLDKWAPHLLLQASEVYLLNAIQSSVSSRARTLATLPSLDRTLTEVAAHYKNIVEWEIILEATKVPAHPFLPHLSTILGVSPDTAYMVGNGFPGNIPLAVYGKQRFTRVVEVVNRRGVSAQQSK